MKNILIYYSFTQNNEKLALHLKKQLNCDVARIETVRKRHGLSILLDMMFNRKPAVKPIPYHLQDYDHIIFLSPIWAGKVAMPLKSFLLREKANVKRYSFVTLCGGRPGQKEKITAELISILDKKPANILELWINKLLPVGKKDSVKYTSGYRIDLDEFGQFEPELNDFIKEENWIKKN
jgi:flavodoxin